MTTETQNEKVKDAAEKSNIPAAGSGRSNAAITPDALDWAVFGCLVAGAVGIFKACGMDSPLGVLLCLLGSVAAFGVIIYAHMRKH